MANILTITGTGFTDTTLPVLKALSVYEARILATGLVRGWWDASSSAYRTDASGKAAALLDRSGNGLNMVQATGANQPAVSAGALGTIVPRDAIVFDGTTDLYLRATNVFDGTNVWSQITYLKWGVLAGNSTPVSPLISTMAAFSQGAPGSGIYAFNLGINKLITGGVSNRPAGLFTAINGTSEYAEMLGESASVTAGVSITFPTAGETYQIGAYQTSRTNKMNGLFCEHILIKGDIRVISGAQQLFRDYFAFKYER